jgi:hypothetical protein
LWMMTGFLHNRVDVCDTSGTIASSETKPALADDMCYSSSLEQRRGRCAKGGEAMVEEVEQVEQEEGVSDGGFGG